MNNIVNNRNGTIDLMKFIFAIFIFVHHSGQFAPICVEGYIGVEFFYMVTGILLAKKFAVNNEKNDDIWLRTRAFLEHKLKAFYLEFLVATCTGFVLLHILIPNVVPAIIHGLFLAVGDLFLLQIFGFPVSSVVGTLWYLSAMMGAFMVIVPLILKYQSFFTNIGAPLICLIGYGTIAFKYGHMSPIMEPVFDGFIHIGLIRAIADISLGYLLYFISTKIMATNFTILGLWLLTLIEIASYLFIIYCMVIIKQRGNIDFIIILFLALSIAISFSQKSLIFPYFQKTIFNKLGLLSLNIFLNHFYIGFIITQMGGGRLASKQGFAVLLSRYVVMFDIQLFLLSIFKKNELSIETLVFCNSEEYKIKMKI